MRSIKGIYCIKVNDCIVYVGKSIGIGSRVINHAGNIFDSKENKYKLIKDSVRRNLPVTFWVIEECEEWKLSEKEVEWIKILKPCLNSAYNQGLGSKIEANDYYDQVFNNSTNVSGMYKILTLSYEGRRIRFIREKEF